MLVQSRYQTLQAFIETSNRCRNQGELSAVFGDHLARLGIDMFAFSYVHHQNDIAGHGMLSTYPQDWLDHYTSNNYMAFDPVYRVGWEKSGVFDWASMGKSQPLSRDEARLMNEAADAGLKSGAAASIHLGYGNLIGFGFASSCRHAFGRDHLSQLYAMAGQFQLVYTALVHKPERPEVKLSARQKEVLRWTATGKTRADIAEIMGISEDTVDDHLRQIFRKLRCNDKVVAVLRAVQIGAISI
ncbi:autoinducer binding domain-containing protein [Pleomorphomonas sp. NRK KF1]|uniref:autoinducer binding domain-containing protein n=1 Tax=Pleomorphomonas sp. NRK KF1 TaxID=2943000 RepID=UPI00204308AC|nr:autoinducer binding domain-containing protein [Pleomorphomonas sp. NRK KF1]MCM5555285.1 LuxR family transcriptional regulator [Pleomorphomonas sp. NRK KF1]